MKRQYLAIALVAVALLAVGCTRKKQTGNNPPPPPAGGIPFASSPGVIPDGWIPFFSDTYGYSFNFPEKWRFHDASSDMHLILSNGDSTDLKKQGVVVLDIGVLPLQRHQKNFKAYLLSTVQNKKNVSSVDEWHTSIGLKVHSLSFDGDGGRREQVYAVEKGSGGYWYLYARGNIKDPAIKSIVESLGFQNPADHKQLFEGV